MDIVVTYALMKTLYDEGKDYIDAFWPFAIKVFPTDKAIDAVSLQVEIIDDSSLSMPIHVLNTVLKRATKRGLIERVNHSQNFRITELGIAYKDKLETNKDVDRQTNALLEDIKTYYAQKGIEKTCADINIQLKSFINNNIEPLLEILNSSLPPEAIAPRYHREDESLLLEYLNLAERQKPVQYDILQNMIFGSIIAAVLYTDDSSELAEIGSKKFGCSEIYLDSNILLSVLDLTFEQLAKPARELFELLKKHCLDIKVFSFTKDEICRVLKGYLTESDCYPSSIRVNSLYSSLKSKGWSKSDTLNYIANIESKLAEHGIGIRYFTSIDMDTYEPSNPKWRQLIGEHKPDQPLQSQNHDLAAIEIIAKIRKHPTHKIEDSKAIFLSSDAKLERFNFEVLDHKESMTIPEVILDRALACILWLKNPSAEVPLRAIIASHSRDLFIKQRIWLTFYKNLSELRQEGQIDDKSIETLFMQDYIENVLKPLDEVDANNINKDFVLTHIENAAKIIKNNNEIRENAFINALARTKSDIERKKDEEKADQILTISKRSEVFASKWFDCSLKKEEGIIWYNISKLAR